MLYTDVSRVKMCAFIHSTRLASYERLLSRAHRSDIDRLFALRVL